MKPQYQTRYEWLCESYQKWLTGFTRHAVSRGMCHPNIYYFHNLTPGWVSFNGEKPEIAIVPQSLHRLIYGNDKRATPPLDDDLVRTTDGTVQYAPAARLPLRFSASGNCGRV